MTSLITEVFQTQFIVDCASLFFVFHLCVLLKIIKVLATTNCILVDGIYKLRQLDFVSYSKTFAYLGVIINFRS